MWGFSYCSKLLEVYKTGLVVKREARDLEKSYTDTDLYTLSYVASYVYTNTALYNFPNTFSLWEGST